MKLQRTVSLVVITLCLLAARRGMAIDFDAPLPPPVLQYHSAPSDIAAAAISSDEITPVTPASEASTLSEAMTFNEPVDCYSSKKQKALSKAAATAHKGLFFDNNFDYLCDEFYGDWFLGDSLKRRSWNDSITYDIGGQYRMRYQNENNHRGLGLTGVDDQFLLQRTRLYASVQIGRRFRLYAEMLDAESNYEQFGPRPIEVNRTEAQNLFGEAMLVENDNGELWGRIGRMELLFGTQRTVSPLDWANTRRKFEGGSLYWEGADWDVDAFWTRPVPIDDRSWDSPDQSQEFMGLYSTYKALKDETLDLYFLRYSETAGAGFNFNTFGSRWEGNRGAWLWEAEGDYQFGEVQGANQDAFAYTLGLGRKFDNLLWTPTLWAYYDWAKGDTQVNGVGTGYNHLFPLSHKYMGFMDLFGRRNLKDTNFLLTLKPTKKVKLLMWYHIFNLENGNDVPYSVAMTPLVTTPGGSTDLGQELDLLASWNINERLNLVLGYSRFFAGEFFSTNPTSLYAGDANFYYAQFTVDF